MIETRPSESAPTAAVHPVVAWFQVLGDRIAAQLGKEPEDAKARLEAIAVAELSAANPSQAIGFDDLVAYVLDARTLCPQADLDGKFAEPPLSLYHGGTFDISALVWLDGTTSIHQHAFSGAFHVLSGSSIHSRYRFRSDGNADDEGRAMTGRLDLIDIEVLRAGDTRAITRGPDLIHALFHMVRPSVTIVVRTICDEAKDGPQYDYRWPGVAYHPFQRHAPTIRRLQYLGMLRKLDPVAALGHLRHVLAGADIFLAYTLLSDHLLGTGDLAATRELAAGCLALESDTRDRILAAAHNDLLSRALVDLRCKLHEPDHRFLLALLLNVFDREALLGVVAREKAAPDPVARVITWLREMTGHTERFPNLLGLDFNDTVFEVLESMWRGHGCDATLSAMAARHGEAAIAGQHDALSALFHALRDCPLFFQVFRSLPD